MNELTKKWIDALRSGNYPQTKGLLHSTEGYCCLGVLCEVAGVEWDRLDPSTYGVRGYGNVTSPPGHIQDMVPCLTKNDNFTWDLMAANDDGNKTFSEIADMIERRANES